MRHAAWLALALAGGCFSKDDDTGATEADGADGTGGGCGTVAAFVYGTVSGAEAPTVTAENDAGESVPADWYGTPEDGAVPYELNVLNGDWLVTATADGCTSQTKVLSAEACTEYEMNFELECSR